MTKTESQTITRRDALAVFDDRYASLRLYALVTALSLGLALILELGIGVAPAKVLIVVLPTSVLLLVTIPLVRSRLADHRDTVKDTGRSETNRTQPLAR